MFLLFLIEFYKELFDFYNLFLHIFYKIKQITVNIKNLDHKINFYMSIEHFDTKFFNSNLFITIFIIIFIILKRLYLEIYRLYKNFEKWECLIIAKNWCKIFIYHFINGSVIIFIYEISNLFITHSILSLIIKQEIKRIVVNYKFL